jgi:membrane-associated phospholipid phosphatase
MSIQAWDIGLIPLLQRSGDWLEPVMEIITALGYPQAYMVLVAVVYWSLDRKLGLRLAVFLSLVGAVNSLLKLAFHAPRPYWVSAEVRAIHASNGFGMPSGHAQASTVWILASSYLGRGWFWIMAILLAFLIGLSRPFLGVHFPTQVLAGWVVGIAIMIFFLKFEQPVLFWFSRLSLSRQLLVALGLTCLVMLAGMILLCLSGGWEMPREWTEYAAPYRTINPSSLRSYSLASIAGNAGSILGIVMGSLLLERAGGFRTSGLWWIRLVRTVVGLACLFLLYLGLQQLDPGEGQPAAYAAWRFLGLCLISFLALYLLPLIFNKLGLATSEKGGGQNAGKGIRN